MYKELPQDTYSVEAYYTYTCDSISIYSKYNVYVYAVTTNNQRQYLFDKPCVNSYEATDELEKAYKHYNIPQPINKADYLRKIGRLVIIPYFDEIKRSMTWLGQQDNIRFIGQTCGVPGTFMYPTLEGVPPEKRMEFPVCESLNMQFGLGVALTHKTVVLQYPRMNFLILAASDMANMVDKMPKISNNKVIPHIIIRTSIGPSSPVDCGPQHKSDFTVSFKTMFDWIKVKNINCASQAMSVYQEAYNYKGTTLVIEDGNKYND